MTQTADDPAIEKLVQTYMDKLEKHTDRVNQAVGKLHAATEAFKTATKDLGDEKKRYQECWKRDAGAFFRFAIHFFLPLITPIITVIALLILVNNAECGRIIEALGVKVTRTDCDKQPDINVNPAIDTQSPSSTAPGTPP